MTESSKERQESDQTR